jgi:hypothetical protein
MMVDGVPTAGVGGPRVGSGVDTGAGRGTADTASVAEPKIDPFVGWIGFVGLD